MSEPLLRLLAILLVALVYLFFVRVLRAVWVEIRDPKPVAASKAPKGKKESGPTKLRVLDPPNLKGKIYALAPELTVGRAPGCQIHLDDTFSSQLHARIFRKDGQYFLEDLGSTNGTFLNRKKVTAPVPFRTGDRLQIGRTVLEVRK